MSNIAKPRVGETTTVEGTGAATLLGAMTAHQRFSAVCSVADTVYYDIEAIDGDGLPTGDWEEGIGTYSSANTLTRTTPQHSSNAGAAVVFTAGTKRVRLILSVEQMAAWDAKAITTGTLAQFAATTSAQLAGVISDETGSGALVFGTSPTLVTPALGTPTAVVLTNATGTAAGLTAGTVTTNANLTGDVTSVGNAATVVKINGTSLAGLATGILKNTTTTGVPSIAIAADFPTLNQNTSGSAATLTTPRSIYGNNFDGSAALAQVIASTFGGTGNGFAKFSGPTTAEKTFTLPDASATILTSNAAVTVAQGGTGAATFTDGGVLIGNGTGAVQVTTAGTAGQVLTSNGAGVDPTFQAAGGGGSMVWIARVTASGAATADVEWTNSATYDNYLIVGKAIYPSTASATLQILLKVNGTYQTAGYRYHANISNDAGSGYASVNGAGAAAITATAALLNSVSTAGGMTFWTHDPASTTAAKQISWQGGFFNNSATAWAMTHGTGLYGNAQQALTGVRFQMSSGNTNGVWDIYGVTHA